MVDQAMHDCTDARCVLPHKHELWCVFIPPIEVDYTNWRGDRRIRRISPTGPLVCQANPPWHPEKQWLVQAICHEDGKLKHFAVAGIRSWIETGSV